MFNDTPEEKTNRLLGVKRMVLKHKNSLHSKGIVFMLFAFCTKVGRLLRTPHTLDSTYIPHPVVKHWLEREIRQYCGIDPLTHRTMSGHSVTELWSVLELRGGVVSEMREIVFMDKPLT